MQVNNNQSNKQAFISQKTNNFCYLCWLLFTLQLKYFKLSIQLWT